MTVVAVNTAAGAAVATRRIPIRYKQPVSLCQSLRHADQKLILNTALRFPRKSKLLLQLVRAARRRRRERVPAGVELDVWDGQLGSKRTQLTKRPSTIEVSHKPLVGLLGLARLCKLDNALALALLALVEHLGERDVADRLEELDEVLVCCRPRELGVRRAVTRKLTLRTQICWLGSAGTAVSPADWTTGVAGSGGGGAGAATGDVKLGL